MSRFIVCVFPNRQRLSFTSERYVDGETCSPAATAFAHLTPQADTGYRMAILLIVMHGLRFVYPRPGRFSCRGFRARGRGRPAIEQTGESILRHECRKGPISSGPDANSPAAFPPTAGGHWPGRELAGGLPPALRAAIGSDTNSPAAFPPHCGRPPARLLTPVKNRSTGHSKISRELRSAFPALTRGMSSSADRIYGIADPLTIQEVSTYWYLRGKAYGRMAQLVGQLGRNFKPKRGGMAQSVVPAGYFVEILYGCMAQLVEHIVHIDGVTGSSPVATTNPRKSL